MAQRQQHYSSLTLPEQNKAKGWVSAVSACMGDVPLLLTSIPALTKQMPPELAISTLRNLMCYSALQGTPENEAPTTGFLPAGELICLA